MLWQLPDPGMCQIKVSNPGCGDIILFLPCIVDSLDLYMVIQWSFSVGLSSEKFSSALLKYYFNIVFDSSYHLSILQFCENVRVSSIWNIWSPILDSRTTHKWSVFFVLEISWVLLFIYTNSFFFFETASCSIAQAGVQRCNHGSLQPWLPWAQAILPSQPPK